MTPIRLSTPSDFRKVVEDHDHWLFDCDGVIWHGENLIPGVLRFLHHLRTLKKTICFVTNSGSKSREDLRKKFDRLGLEVHLNEVFGSAYATVAYLKYNLDFPPDKKVYVIGSAGLEHELKLENIEYKGGTVPADNILAQNDGFPVIAPDPSIGAVICGFDGLMNYTKLAKAHSYLRENRGCHFLLTNDDNTYAGPDGRLYPAAGSISASLRYAVADIMSPIVVGKPNRPFMDTIDKLYNLDRKRTIMVGDRLDTDILSGRNGGVSTLMVLTGVHKVQHFEREDAVMQPDFYVDSLGDLAVLSDGK